MLPPDLQALKNAAASVRKEHRDVNREASEASWRKLTGVAKATLGPLWEYVANMRERPHRFPREGPPWGSFVFAAKVKLPGHREITVLFCGRDKTNMADADWWRAHWPGAPTSDVERGVAYYMVEPSGDGRLMTYYQTLGAALLAAEMR